MLCQFFDCVRCGDCCRRKAKGEMMTKQVRIIFNDEVAQKDVDDLVESVQEYLNDFGLTAVVIMEEAEADDDEAS